MKRLRTATILVIASILLFGCANSDVKGSDSNVSKTSDENDNYSDRTAIIEFNSYPSEKIEIEKIDGEPVNHGESGLLDIANGNHTVSMK
jgi:hypothetical protein